MNSDTPVRTPILIVDDDFWMLRLIMQRLSSEDYNIEAVITGTEAIAWIKNHPESIVIIDYLLVDMTADVVLNSIDDQDSLVEFIVMTSIKEIKIAVAMMQLGAYDFIIKDNEFLATLPMVLEKVEQHLSIRKQLKISIAQLQVLSSRLQVAQEEERHRIAQEIHDELGQSLTAIKLDLSWLKGEIPAGLNDMIGQTIELTDRSIDTVRQISSRLRPRILDHLGLLAAIEWHIKEFNRHSPIVCRLKNKLEEVHFSDSQSIALYRILQESLTNVVRHSGAKTVVIDLKKQANQLVMNIADDGKGVTNSQLHNLDSLGIAGMLERLRPWKGQVTITNRKRGGTLVSARLPWQKSGTMK